MRSAKVRGEVGTQKSRLRMSLVCGREGQSRKMRGRYGGRVLLEHWPKLSRGVTVTPT